MLKIPLPEIIAKIKEKKSISEAEINAKIDSKLKQLSGLISREGAAHIVANELGVKLFDEFSGKLQIKNILSGMRNVETVAKVTKKFELREFKTETREGKVASMYVGDETGSIRITMWGDQALNIRQIKEGDVVKIVGGYVRENMGKIEVHLNDRSKLVINPPGEVVTVKFGQSQSEFPKAERKSIKDLQEQDQNVEILGTIVQAFEPRFFEVCPQCGKRAKYEVSGFMCPEHSMITPDYSYVMNVVLDDGTENIRCTFFRNQAEKLLGKTKPEMLKFKDAPETMDSIKTSLLGEQVKIVGRANKNQMFDRLEFTAQLVFTNPNPDDELNRLNSKPSNPSISNEEKTEEEFITEEVEKIN